MNLQDLVKKIEDHFNLPELRDLSFQMDITFDDLRGETKSDKSRELVQYCDRRGKVDALVVKLIELRSNVNWLAPQFDSNHSPSKPQDESLIQERDSTNYNELTVEKIRLLLSDFSDDSFYIKDNIPLNKLNNAINSYATDIMPDQVLILYDDTLFETAKKGVLLTKDSVHWKINQESGHCDYTEINHVKFDHSIMLVTGNLQINDWIIPIGDGSLTGKVGNALATVLRSLIIR
ncbi:MAG: hypothetical protein AB8G95_22375 [Anaerolineae bacterium]